MTALDVRQPAAALAIRSGQEMWDDKQRAALAVLGIKDATNADLAVFMHVCQRTGLDPFTKQIYMISRRDQGVMKQTIQVGIDGFRVIRDRAARRDGVEVEYEDTRWYDADGLSYEIWLRPEPPAGCGMTVLKNGKRYPAVLTYAEYVQKNKDGKPIGKWRDAPAHQLEKCCEAFGLRRAFPHDLAGIQLEDETPAAEHMPAHQNGRVTAAEITSRRDQRPQNASPAGEPQTPAAASPPSPPADPAGEAQDDPERPPAKASSGQLGILRGQLEKVGYNLDSPDDMQAALRVTGILAQADDLRDLKELDQDQAARATRWLRKCDDGAALELLLADGEVSDDA